MPNILVIDDCCERRRAVSSLLSARPDWTVVEAHGEKGALTLAGLVPLDLILASLGSGGDDGLQLLDRLSSLQPLLPMIVVADDGNEAVAAQALQWRAAGYVNRRRLAGDLVRVVERVLNVAAEHVGRILVQAVHAGQSTLLELGNDTSCLPAVVRYLTSQCCRFGVTDEADQVRVAIALEEALLNAIIHGNLEVGSELRERADDAYRQMIDARRQIPKYGDRRVYLQCDVDCARARIVIRDEGPGFDVSSLPDPRDPQYLTRASGRGVLLMHTFMDEVAYNASGNEVTLIKRRRSGDPLQPGESQSLHR